ncbi:MAG: DUF2169 domain-containing protein [Planctomycetia bacterium]|nr:DUF2169 domain-containing protein [Planctomycetia bacterium]
MKILNRNPEILVPTWLVGRFGPEPRGDRPLDAAFIVKATFQIAADGSLVPREGGPLQPEGDRSIGDDPALGLAYASDFVPTKPRAEYTVVGTAHRPASAPANRFSVAVELAGRRKALVITGTRSWEETLLGHRPGTPAYVDRQLLTYAAAHGGPRDHANPLGVGRTAEAVPAIEHASAPLTSPGDTHPPAGFGPLAREWRQRRDALAGFGPGWLKDRWPWLPQGFDPEHFMAAPPDQRLPGFLRGDEPAVFENLCAEAAEVRTRLPGIRARLFVLEKTGPRLHDPLGDLCEVPLALDTLAVDLDARTVVLVWRGIRPVRSLALRDVAAALLFAEPLAAVDQPPAHYRAWLEEGMPVASPPPDAAARLAARKQAQTEAEVMKAGIKDSIRAGMTYPAHVREQLAALVADVEAKRSIVRDGSKLPDLAGALATYDDRVATVEAARDQILALARPTPAKVDAILAAATGPSEDPTSPALLRQQLAEMLEQVKGSLQRKPAGFGGRLQAAVEQTIAKQEELIAFRERLDAELAANTAKIDAALPKWALREPLDPAEPIDPEAARRDGFEHMDVSGFDCSGLDLAGVDFRHAIAADARFVAANLAGADFTNADLTGADFTRADLSGANLAGADLTTATLAGARLAGANLTGAKLADVDLAGLDLSNVIAPQADFSRANLERARFDNALLERANFAEATLTAARFAAANLGNASLAGAHAAGADFSAADLTAMRSGQGADFAAACFRLARAAGSVWEDAVVDRADFSGAMLDRANFTQAFGRGARFHRCHLADATLDDAVLVDAVLSESRLLRASLARADLSRARCDGANLFAASLWNAVLVDTDFRGANLGRANVSGAVRAAPDRAGARA